MLTVSEPTTRPFGAPSGLAGFGIEPRWVCIEGPAGSQKSRAVELVREALVDLLASTCVHLGAGAIGRDCAEEMVRQVQHVRQPGAVVQLSDGSAVGLRDVASASLPPAAEFGLFLADRVIQNRRVLDLLQWNDLVIQERGAFSTYVYQCVLGGISPSLFASVTSALTPELPDLLVLLSSPDAGGVDGEAYRNPPVHILRLCARNFAMVSTDGLDARQVAEAIVGAMSGRRLVLPLT